MPGPAPKPPDQRARRNATLPMTSLPAEGRKGRAPAWPLGEDLAATVDLKLLKERIPELVTALPEATGRERSKLERQLATARRGVALLEARIKTARKLERELWAQLWKTPQATQWEKLAWTRTVAQYVRWKIAAELGDLDSSKEARQLEDRLGLNPLALLKLRWEIGEQAASSTGTPERRSAARARYGNLRVVASGE